MKIVSQLDSLGFYVGPAVADESPLEEGVFLIPAGAIDMSPPEFQARFHHKIKWDGSQFIEVENEKPAAPVLQEGETLQFDEAAWDWVVIPAPAPEPAPVPEPEPITPDQLAAGIRAERGRKISAVAWRYERIARQERLGITPTDNIAVLDAYVQALADITLQPTFPQSVDWPDVP